MKIPLLLVAGLVLALPACSSDSGDSASFGSDASAPVSAQAPWTQTDIDLFIQIYPQIGSIQNDEQSSETLLKSYNISRERFIFLQMKWLMCKCRLEIGEECDLSLFEPKVWPNEAEMDLARANETALKAAEALYWSERAANR